MSSQLKPIKLYGAHGANPPKVAIILEELGLPFEIIHIPLSDVKSPDYVALNPNGRLPTIQDPNLDITIWESGAIVEYLIERYDTEHKLSFAPGTVDSYHARQWLFFQVSGQGPYFGQASWFKKFHHEKLPSAIDRYLREVERVNGVLESWLAKQKDKDPNGDGPWLVGGKMTFADLSFVPYHRAMGMALPDDYSVEKFPLVKEWCGKMLAREKTKLAFEKMTKASS
ncbi:glutathione S-transferase [Exophiala viscosa]|uniref:Glutathione S-transferase n=1 Tax=Exophiala viscosa TaxID=2486360 RepID=A0AAN6DLQ7_9EURO|nr:glutathione S-transferase [Exophiala viscosa]KAI1625416.1 glutathione S-transferase [Exophiala viscosa]